MKTNNKVTKCLSFILCLALIAAVALTAIGCTSDTTASTEVSASSEATAGATASTAQATDIGEGARAFCLTVTDGEGVTSSYNVKTDKATVGEALSELGIISGEQGDFGLYIKAVNGITADYETDGTYWAFYVNGEYAMSSVDQTDIEDGASYGLKVEK